MNDRYLFRGKRLDNGEWAIGSYLSDFGGDSWIVSTGTLPKSKEETGNIWGKVRKSTIGQCTGIKDKNGVLIFEGGIVYIPDWECYAEVLWDCGDWELYFGPESSSSEYLYDNADKCVVVGNVHDTPELLEKSEANT